jgi:hypothetical protein
LSGVLRKKGREEVLGTDFLHKFWEDVERETGDEFLEEGSHRQQISSRKVVLFETDFSKEEVLGKDLLHGFRKTSKGGTGTEYFSKDV